MNADSATNRQNGAKVKDAIRSQIAVLYALLLHDIKSRFMGNGLGYVLTIVWPLSHMVLIMVIFTVTGRTNPFGVSILLFAATGVIPYIVVSYISRFMLLSALTNKSYLQYPLVNTSDLLVARGSLEVISAVFVICFLFLGLSVLGVDCAPASYLRAAEAISACVVLGLGFGFLGGAITFIFPFFNIIYTLGVIGMYASCGLVFVPDALPEVLQSLVWYNPILHLIVWLRLAFYPSFPHHIMSETYPLLLAAASFVSGLVMTKLLSRV
jgi:capsular polysaccharide transport system permease protein